MCAASYIKHNNYVKQPCNLYLMMVGNMVGMSKWMDDERWMIDSVVICQSYLANLFRLFNGKSKWAKSLNEVRSIFISDSWNNTSATK